MTPSTMSFPASADAPGSDGSSLVAVLGYDFADPGLLVKALTHRSWCAENEGASNERLEFLGDAVRGLVIAEYAFEDQPELPEGQLAKIRASVVSAPALAATAREIGLGKALRLGHGESSSGGSEKESILADALEAVIGAVYLDGGYQQVRKFIKRLFASLFANLPDLNQLKDSKTQLQELLQHDGNLLPAYTLVKIMGADHNQLFYVDCNIEKNNLKTTGKGSSRRNAEQQAAKDMLFKLNEKGF